MEVDPHNLDQQNNSGIYNTIMWYIDSAHIFDLAKIALIGYFILIVVMTLLGKTRAKSARSITTRERVLKRFLFANQDVLNILDEDDKKLLTQTFENTLKNTQTVDIKEPERSPEDAKKFKKRVEFNLNKIQYHNHVPYDPNNSKISEGSGIKNNISNDNNKQDFNEKNNDIDDNDNSSISKEQKKDL